MRPGRRSSARWRLSFVRQPIRVSTRLIPAACDTKRACPAFPPPRSRLEDMAWMQRITEAGHEVVVKLYMEAKNLPEADSANVIAELVGSEKPEEVVVMGGHYDSWDVGQSAQDDGAACIAAWQALKILKDLGLRPRRTLRVVLWTNEENGLAGGRAYREMVGDDIDRHVAAIEMDGGAESPIGFGFGLEGVASDDTSNPTYELGLRETATDRSPPEWHQGRQDPAWRRRRRHRPPDARRRPRASPTNRPRALPLLGRHTHADTLDKVDPQDFRKAVAILGVMGYVLADMPTRLVAR